MSRTANLCINILATALYLIAANPLITGWPLHEWVSLGVVLIFLVHCAVHYDWIVRALKERAERFSLAHLVLDFATLAVFMVVTVSGMMVSRVVLPLFGFVGQGYFFWSPVHAIFAKALFALLLIHVAAHWRWFAQMVRRRAGGQPKTDVEGV